MLAHINPLLAAHRRDTDLCRRGSLPYEILREIGHGGMGTVYLAVRADHAFRKQVALKIVRTKAGSKDVLRRFQRKREILATLDHSNYRAPAGRRQHGRRPGSPTRRDWSISPAWYRAAQLVDYLGVTEGQLMKHGGAPSKRQPASHRAGSLPA